MKKVESKTLIKFLSLLAVLGAYFCYLSLEYGVATGGLVAALTWSFFVLCTPIADGGFLLDFPIRILFKIRMAYTEMIVWCIAITLNITSLRFAPEMYEKTFLTDLFHKILTTPYPYWSIIILSALGTFLSIYFGDKIIDLVKKAKEGSDDNHKHRYRLLAMLSLFALIIYTYYHLLTSLGIDIDKLGQ